MAPRRRLAQPCAPGAALACSGVAALVLSVAASLGSSVELRREYALSTSLDVLITVYLTGCLLSLQRPGPMGGALSVILGNLPLAASGAKLAVLGSSAWWSDLALVPDLARAVGPWRTLSIGAVIIGVGAVFILNAAPRRGRAALLAWVPVAAALALAAAASLSPVAARGVADRLPMRIFDHPRYGHLGEAYVEAIGRIDRRHAMAAASGGPPPGLLAGARVPPLQRRNVHVVVVESLMDPTRLPRLRFSREPLGPLFARWRAGSADTSVNPIFGNRSSNTEFEVLCGMPASVGPSDVVFRMLPKRPLDCLPRLLGRRGFRSLSLVPNARDFFRADDAYEAMGFQDRLFQADLDMDDLDGAWLSAEATLRQAFVRVEALLAGAGPVLSYVFVNAGHFPYERDTDKRPDMVDVTPEDPLVEAYVNAAHHNAVAVEEYVSRLRERDPAALVVVLGDHQPLLGADFRGYRLGGRLPAEDDVPPLHRAGMYETPLLILDAGVQVPVGRLPAYLLPEVVLDRLSGGAHCRANACPSAATWRLRPFRDHAFEIEAAGPGERLCLLRGEETDPLCTDVAARSLSWQLALFRLASAR